jgi:hypothetical protein
MVGTATEVSGQLKRSNQVVLDASGNGVMYFSTPSAHQRWEVTGVVVSTNQPASATVVPVAITALNTTSIDMMSPGNQRGATWSGNQDTGRGLIDVGPCDFLSVIFAPPAGSTPDQIAQLAGITCYAVITGTRYTRTR